MALVLGTNCGFVSARPSGDPAGTHTDYNGYVMATRDTTAGDTTTITEIGFWADGTSPGFAAQTVNVGIYEVGDGDVAGALVDSDSGSVDGTDDEWKWVTVSITVSSSTKYFIAVAFGDTGSVNYGDSTEANTGAWKSGALADPFTAGGYYPFPYGCYAVESAGATGTNMQININDSWKEVPAAYVNVDDSWKSIAGISVNVDDSWKEVF